MVSVVGTLLSLLVFFALFGIFLTQYLPLWMSEDEQELTVQVQTSLADLKTGIDGQVTAGGPAVVAIPLLLSSQSVPLLTQPTSAAVVFEPPGSAGGPYSGYSISPAPGSASSKTSLVQNVTVGNLQVTIPSRYYTPEAFSLENDAIVQTQTSTQQVLEFPPTISFNVSAGGFGVTAALIVLTGVSTSASGSGTEEIFTHFQFTQSFVATSANASESAAIVEGTNFPCAWYNFMNSTLHNSAPAGFGAHVASLVKPPASACTGQPGSSPYPFKVQFTNLASFKLIYAEVRLVIGVGTD